MSPDRCSIVVVDDEPESLKLLTDLLSLEGYQVRPADSGELALASSAIAPPDLVILDVRMPGMGGFEICRQLKDSNQTRDIPVIFLSGSTEEQQHLEGFEVGAVDFVTKPFRQRELLARVRTQLELRRLRVELEKRVAERTEDLRVANEQLRLELTERKRAEETLRESEERFRNMANSTSVMIVASGPDKRATFFNKGWLEFTGRSMAQELDFGWTEGVHADDLPGCLSGYNRLFESVPRPNCHLEYRLRRSDGEYRAVVCTGAPRYAADGRFAGYVASAIDVTDMKRAQEETLARQKLESLGVLSGGVAHDFNNLLAGMIAEAGLAEAELTGPDSGRDSAIGAHINKIKSIAFHASDIVRQLMIYSGREKGEIESLNLSLIVQEMLELLKASISKRASLTIHLDKDLPAIEGNAAQLRQVVMNLMLNASEALGEKAGEIRVITSRVRAGDCLQLEVADTGCGMPDEIKAKIFDPFYTTKATGKGLGLALVQTIVRNHGGSVSLTSALGQGTTVRILLPHTERRGRHEPTNQFNISYTRPEEAGCRVDGRE
jgi:PAS domain S-box-containing protein